MGETDNINVIDEFEEVDTDNMSDDDFDEIEEINEYEEDEDEEEDDEDYDEDEEEEYDEDEEDEDYDEDEEYEEDEEDGDYEDKFDKILTELQNLNTNLTQGSTNVYSEKTVPYTDPYVNSEVSRMRDEVMRNGFQQNISQNNALISEISKMREEMNKTQNQNMQMEMMKLRSDVQGAAPSKNQGRSIDTYDFFMQSELAKMREEMTKNSMNGMNAEVARLREEMQARSIKDEMNKELEELRRQMRERDLNDRFKEQESKKSAPSSELEEVRSQMNKLRQEITEAISQGGSRNDMTMHAAQHSTAARDSAMTVLEEIRRLREDVAHEQEKNKEELSKKIDSVSKRSEDDEKRSREILNAISKMFISSSRELKGITYKNQEIANSFQNAIKNNLQELQDVKGEITKIKVTPLSDYEDVARRSNREVVNEIGSQLGALAKDIISKVDNQDAQEAMYKQLTGIKNEIQKSSDIFGERSKKQEDMLKNIAYIQNERGKKQEDIIRGFTDVQGERIKRQEELLASISDIMSKNGGMMDSILAETKRSMELAAKGHQMNISQFNQLKETIKNVTMRQLSELSGLKRQLSKLEGTGEQIAQIDRKIMTLSTDANKAVDELSTEIKKGISDMSNYSYADQIVDVIKKEINTATSEALNYSFRGIKSDLKHEVTSAMNDSSKDIVDRIDTHEARVMKAIDNVHIDGLDKMISEIKDAVNANGATGRESIAELSHKIDEHAELSGSIRRDISNITREIQRSTEKSTQLLAGVAKRMIKEFTDSRTISQKLLSSVKQDIKSIFDANVQQVDAVKNAIIESNPKADIISYVGDKLDTIYSGVDGAIAQVQERLFAAISDERGIREIKSSLDKVASDIKSEIGSKLDISISELNDSVGMINHSFNENITRVNDTFGSNMTKMNDMFTGSMDRVTSGFDKGVAKINEAVTDMSGKLRESTEGMKSILSGIAKRMIKEFDENKQVSSRMFASVKKDIETAYSGTINEFEEYKKALLDMDKSDDMLDIIGVRLDKVTGEIQNSIDKIKEEILFTTGSKDQILEISNALDAMSRDIKSELARGINLQNEASISLSEQLSALAEVVEKNSEKQISTVLETVAEKVNDLMREVRSIDLLSIKNDFTKSFGIHEQNIINSLEDKMSDKLSRQEQAVLSAFSEQIKDIKTSLVDVIGQNDIIENIAKNVRDVKSELDSELKQLDNSELIQELISQLNLLSEYMLQSGKQNLEDRDGLVAKLDTIRSQIAEISVLDDIEPIRKEIFDLKDRIEDSKIESSVLVSLIEQVNSIDENLSALKDDNSENEEIIGSLTELSAKLARLNASVDAIKDKEISIPVSSDTARVRAAQIMSEKLLEIKDAILDAIAAGSSREDAMRFAETLGKIAGEIDGRTKN